MNVRHQFCGGSLAGKESMPHMSISSSVGGGVARGRTSRYLMSMTSP